MTSIITNLANGLALFGIAGASIGVILFGNALTNTFMALCLLGCLLHPKIWNISSWKMVPIGLWLGLALFLWAVVASMWSTGSADDIGETLRKYREFLLLPLMWLVVHQLKLIQFARISILVATLVSVFITYLMWVGWYSHPIYGAAQLSLKNHIFFNVSVSFLIYLALFELFKRNWIVVCGIVWGLVSISFAIFFIEDGRTAYVLIPILISWFIWVQIPQVRFRVAALLGLCGLCALTYWQAPLVKQNIDMTTDRLEAYFQGEFSYSSTGVRIGWIMTGLEGWTHKPVLGHGTGSYPSEMMNYVPEGQEKLESSNPHQQYVLFLFEQGLIGVLLFVAFLLALFWQTILQKDYISQGIVLMMIVGSGINSSFLDGTESQFYWILLLLFLKPNGWRESDAQDKPV